MKERKCRPAGIISAADLQLFLHMQHELVPYHHHLSVFELSLHRSIASSPWAGWALHKSLRLQAFSKRILEAFMQWVAEQEYLQSVSVSGTGPKPLAVT